MTSAIERQKSELIRAAQALAETHADTAAPALLARFIAVFYEHVPPADVAARAPADLCAGALALWRFAGRRQPGSAAVRVYNPDAAADGWSSPHTIVEIVNDDMPFLVDSATAAINQGGREARLAIHPILQVARDETGALLRLDPPQGGSRESWMQITISREADAAARAALAAGLVAVLGDVRNAVSDWRAMRRRLQAVAADLAAAPPPLPPGEIAEGMEFLRWLDDDNFTYLGFRDYAVDAAGGPTAPPLGILADGGIAVFGGLRDLGSLPQAVQDFVRRRELLLITKTERRATVHRATHMDAIGVRRFDDAGQVVGLRLFLGLFTSTAYSRSLRSIPLLRQKEQRTLARAGLAPDSHDGKALQHILDTLPRDDLFQIGEEELFDTATGILNLQERQRVALFVRRDPLERFVSCLVYVPRDRYDTRLRQAFADLLAEAFAGTVSDSSVHLDESALARVQFIIATTRGAVPAVDVGALERRVAEAGRTWIDRVAAAAAASFGEAAAHARLRRLAGFPIGYQARTPPAQALADIERIAAVLGGSPFEASLHPREEGGASGLRLYHPREPLVLSDMLPVLEHLGLRVIAEEPFRIETAIGTEPRAVWIHEFTLGSELAGGPLAEAARRRFEEALTAVWHGSVESDGFNRLVLAAGLAARQTTVLRLYCKLLRQAGSAFSQAYMEDTLARHPAIAAHLVRLFELRFDPAAQTLPSPASGGGSLDVPTPASGGESGRGPAEREIAVLLEALDAVESLDEDRILRGFLSLIQHSVRTNYYQRLPSGAPKPALAVKLASHAVDLLPRPRPLYEIYVYSPRTEGVHLRAGKVARGGIRWSDRREDFRTEILGLMKAQTVKNAVIVPVGSKGGFVVKRPPASGSAHHRDAVMAEGVECYKTLIRGMLDVTDNIVAPANGHGEHRIVAPPDVVRHDGDDPYLVVAADKGTATFSDIANGIAEEYGFWLGDAFASGGSKGYDHKELAITSRGAWELVKRHFRELGRDIESAPFTVVGVGDMSGDVFGNFLLRSRHARLLAAFDHRHIFVDPAPDPAVSYAERLRLFRLPRSSWADYTPHLIAPGGGVFDRTVKSVPVSPQMQLLFNIGEEHLTPAALIGRLLAAEVDLLFFGGIGTFVKARAESHAEVGDRANDAVRIDGEDIRAIVVGEGANLGVTERGRIAYALKGGRIDTDAIDNSAGVSMSDHEVNIKILLAGAIAGGRLGRQEREPLLAQMADEVARLVLRDNYLQGEALSVAEARGAGALDQQVRLMRDLERAGQLDRGLEFLPDDEALAARAKAGQGLSRPELAVLLAYAKMSLDTALLASEVPDLPDLADDLRDYFPAALRGRFAPDIGAHPLRREIIATVVTNDLVNRAGLTFVHDLQARTGRSAPETTRAYRIVRGAFGLPALWAAVEALDNRLAAGVQYAMLIDIAGVIEHAATWLLRARRLDIGREIAHFAPAVAHLADVISRLLPSGERAHFDRRTRQLSEAGVPPPLAEQVAAIVFLTSAFEVGDLAERTGRPIDLAARTFYGVGARFALDEMREAARQLPAETSWQRSAAETLIDDFYSLQAELAAQALAQVDERDPLAAWAERRGPVLAPAEALAAELRAAPNPDLAMLVVASRQLRQALGQQP